MQFLRDNKYYDEMENDEKKEIVKEFELGLYDEIKLSYEGGVISIKEIEHGYY